VIPFKGWSMDDAQVISDSFAKRLLSEATTTHVQDFDDDIKGGLHHFQSLFPDRFVKAQLANLDAHGVAKPGTVLQPGDPFILATRPKSVSSTSKMTGHLSRAMMSARQDTSQVWGW
ncbi:MAG: hypothetical protein JWR15_4073, partial [Prosthecobacter sp.]|nr:hypothetical protein [Prosthecobacter sp.]